MQISDIIDTHMHLWDIANGYTWLPHLANGVLNRNFLVEDYRKMAKKQPISKTVYIECGGFPEDPVLETKWVQDQADRYGMPNGIVGFVKLDAADAENQLKRHLQYPNLKGIRMPLNCVAGVFGADRDDYMRDSNWRKGFALLSKYQLHFEMQIFDTQIPDACRLAKDYPDIPIVLQHLGWPIKSSLDYLPQWKSRLEQIASFPNVSLKISCLGWIFQTRESKAILPYLKEALQIFGPDRCLVGSNCPPDTVFIPFDEIFEIILKALRAYPEDEQKKVLSENAKRIYRLPHS